MRKGVPVFSGNLGATILLLLWLYLATVVIVTDTVLEASPFICGHVYSDTRGCLLLLSASVDAVVSASLL